MTMGQYLDLLTIGVDGNKLYAFMLSGNDTIIGSTFDDSLMGSTGSAKIDGGAGNDTVTYRFFDGPVTIDLTNRTAETASGTSKLTSIENAEGGNQDDVFVGNGVANIFPRFWREGHD